jgi:uncharacterized protein (DUF1778 family)
MPTATNRTEKLDLRLTEDAKRVLQTAAAAQQCSVSEFVLGSALARAAETLPDRQRFGLSAEAWEAFHRALDAPPNERPRLARLLKEKSPFDKASKP